MYGPRGIIDHYLNKLGRCLLVGVTHKYQCSRPCGFRLEDYFKSPLHEGLDGV